MINFGWSTVNYDLETISACIAKIYYNCCNLVSNVLPLSAGSITYDATLTQLHADKHMVPVKMSNTGQVGQNDFIILVYSRRFHEWVLKI